MLINDFHKVEKDANLYDLKDDLGYPVWDILRYSVFLKYYYKPEDMARVEVSEKKSFREYFFFLKLLILFIFRISFTKKGKCLIQTASRYKDGNRFYDKSSSALIDVLGKDAVILETYTLGQNQYKTIYDFAPFFRRIYKSSVDLDRQVFQQIHDCMSTQFGKCQSTYDELNRTYHNFQSDVAFYSFIVKRVAPRKIFIAAGNPKAITWVAKKNKIETLQLQHAGFMYEEVEYSYPPFIKYNSNISFADILLTFGEYWGRNMNIPVQKIIPIGNDHFCTKEFESATSRPSIDILVISTIIHGQELSSFIRNYATEKSDLRIVFKLHPNEFKLKDSYKDFFATNKNIKIITTEVDTSTLVNQSKLILLIVSSVLFEALDQNKKVAIYKRLNYDRNISLGEIPNLYYFATTLELDEIIDRKIEYGKGSEKFYEPFNINKLKTYL